MLGHGKSSVARAEGPSSRYTNEGPQTGRLSPEVRDLDSRFSGWSRTARQTLLLPAAAKRLIKLYQRIQLVSLGLCQSEFGRERVRFVGQDFEIIRGSRFEPRLRKLGGILRRFHEMLLLYTELPKLAISD